MVGSEVYSSEVKKTEILMEVGAGGAPTAFLVVQQLTCFSRPWLPPAAELSPCHRPQDKREQGGLRGRGNEAHTGGD